MIIEAEHILEDNLIAQLEELGFKKTIVNNENELLSNLKDQL